MAIAPIELEDALADDSLEMNEAGDKIRVALELQDAIAAHHLQHQNGGPDELDVTGLSGELADAQKPKSHAASHADGAPDELVVTGLSGKLADAQTPLAHKASHQSGGADALNVANLSGELADVQKPKLGAVAGLTVGGANVNGALPTAAPADHKHALPAFGAAAGTFCEGNDARLDPPPPLVIAPMTAVSGMVYLVDSSTQLITITLPSAAANLNKQITVKRKTGANNVAILGAGSDKVDGLAGITLDIPLQWVTLVCDGVGWFTCGDPLVANKVAETSGPNVLAVGAIPTSSIMRRAPTGTSLVGGPLFCDNAGNLSGVGTINGAIAVTLGASDPAVIRAGIAAGPGANTAASRTDHQHDVLTAAPVALVVGGPNAIGNTVELAQAGHKHALPAFGNSAGTFCEGNDARLSAALVNPAINAFRLSTSPTDPLSGVFGNYSTLYLTPYNGNAIALYNGTLWNTLRGSGATLALTGLITDRPADVFAFDNSGSIGLDILNWTNATTRATALARQDGVWVKSGAPTRRYLGTIVAWTATSILHNNLRCAIWNVANRCDWVFSEAFPGTTQPTASFTWQQIGSRFDYVIGIAEDFLFAQLACPVDANGATAGVGIGLDSLTAPATIGVRTNPIGPAGTVLSGVANGHVQTAPGFHYAAALMYGSSTAPKFYGAAGAGNGGLECMHHY